ncbi:helix-turn-helix domain-containing protein [Candidatus Sumerlaeota bacterium]|nr:helix-turn-helix domain-containing protein [Candidatus Sumerlaeota bacterium]
MTGHDRVVIDTIMSGALNNSLKTRREGRGWSQAELAERAGLSRSEVSAIEVGRLVPSTAAAIKLVRALGCTVEQVFSLELPLASEWAWVPTDANRFWSAAVSGRLVRYPVERISTGIIPSDNLAEDADPHRTLAVAGCDPAVGFLVSALSVRGIRVLPFTRSSSAALELLRRKHVHLAGIHLGESSSENAAVVRRKLGPGFRLLHVACWEEGLAVSPRISAAGKSVDSILRSRIRWAGREEGSGARRCSDQLFEGVGRSRKPEGYDHAIRDHDAVAEVIRSGWADAGICVRFAAESAGLRFLTIQREAYDFCYAEEFENDPRFAALVAVLRSRNFTGSLAALPGYGVRQTGETISIS